MDYPPWLPTPANTHAGRLVALARCIHSRHYRTENHRAKGPMNTFDNMCSGDLECTAAVLHLAGFTEFIDAMGRRSVFVCDPDDFETIANGEKADAVPPDQVIQAVLRLADGGFRSSEEIDVLASKLDLDPSP